MRLQRIFYYFMTIRYIPTYNNVPQARTFEIIIFLANFPYWCVKLLHLFSFELFFSWSWIWEKSDLMTKWSTYDSQLHSFRRNYITLAFPNVLFNYYMGVDSTNEKSKCTKKAQTFRAVFRSWRDGDSIFSFLRRNWWLILNDFHMENDFHIEGRRQFQRIFQNLKSHTRIKIKSKLFNHFHFFGRLNTLKKKKSLDFEFVIHVFRRPQYAPKLKIFKFLYRYKISYLNKKFAQKISFQCFSDFQQQFFEK